MELCKDVSALSARMSKVSGIMEMVAGEMDGNDEVRLSAHMLAAFLCSLYDLVLHTSLLRLTCAIDHTLNFR